VKKGKAYRVIKSGNTFLVPAAVGSKPSGASPGLKFLKVKLLVDTGASFTILPIEVVKRLGYDVSHPVGMVRLAAANGIIVAPVVKLSWFNSLGILMKNFQVAVHTIPSPAFDGVLGMDFLLHNKATISIGEAKIYF
jgi:aspartyl protease family protein